MYLVENVGDVANLEVDATQTTLAYVTQTTLSVDDAAGIVAALKARFPAIVGPKKDDICYATQNRQDAVKQLAQRCDLVIVVGSPNSSNSNRLREVARTHGRARPIWSTAPMTSTRRGSTARRRVGVTAGASAPEVLVQRGDRAPAGAGRDSDVVQLEGTPEKVNFPLPKELL